VSGAGVVKRRGAGRWGHRCRCPRPGGGDHCAALRWCCAGPAPPCTRRRALILTWCTRSTRSRHRGLELPRGRRTV